MTPFDIARGYIGTTEGPGPLDNPVIIEMYTSVGQSHVEHDDVAWCAAFVGHCLEKAGIRSTRKLNARSYLDWGVPVEVSDARQGDIGVIPRGTSGWQGHVFFIDRIEGAWVWGLGGNQDDAVNVKRYPVAKLLGVRRAGNVAPTLALPVETVQRRLKDLGYHEVGQIDGKMGPRTCAAILAFRHDNNLDLSPNIDGALAEALTNAPPRPVEIERATGKPEVSRILAASNAQMALGAAGSVGIAVSDLAPLVGQAEDGRDLGARLLDLVGLGSYAPVVMPFIGAVLFLAVIVLAWKARAARIEDHQTGRTL
jgi:uncharacterized protein (TIGR02594 family)